jgi:ABC-2 type transport system ATP-binding protein
MEPVGADFDPAPEAPTATRRYGEAMDITAPDLLIETRGLTKRFGARAALDGVDLRVPPGVAFGLLGPNGAGKTTLIRTLLGLTPATTGSIRVMGHAMPGEHSVALARVGAVVEEPRFHNHLTGRENLVAVSALMTDEATARIPASLDRVGLAARADERVAAYSLGMRQRLGIARCLLSDPRLLILDEPMNGLDPAGILEFRNLIRSFVSEGRTVLISSHMLDEIEKTCDMVAIIDRGRVIREGLLASLNSGSDRRQVLVECDNNQHARALLETQAWVRAVDVDDAGALVVTLSADGSAAAVNRALVLGGIDVARLEPVRESLEDRFLDITSRLQSPEEVPA